FGYPPGEVKFRKSIEGDANVKYGTPYETKSIIKKISRPKILLVYIVMVAVIISIFFYILKNSNESGFAKHKKIEINEKFIAVLPIKNLSDNKENQYFADGVMEDILNYLSAIKEFRVISRSSMEQYRDTKKAIPEIARELQVSYIIESSVQIYQDSVRVIVQLVDAKKDEHIWSQSFVRAYKNIFFLESEIAKQVATELSVTLSPKEKQLIESIPTMEIDAYNLYLKGKFFSSKANVDEINIGIKYFEQAIKKDPEFALAYAELADAILNKNIFGLTDIKDLEKAKEIVLKSIALDNHISKAHTVLAIFSGRIEWDWKKAEKELQLAISLNPNNANAHFHYAIFLHFIKGDFVESRKEIDQALLLDPLSYFELMISSKFYLQQGDFEKAFLETARAQEIDNDNLFSYWVNFENYVKQAKDDKAIDELEKSWNLDTGNKENAMAIRKAYRKSGIKGVYQWIIDLDEKSGSSNVNTYWLAQKYAFIGNKNNALQWLETTLIKNPIEMHIIKYDPNFYNLHNEPRFLTILNKMNLGNYAEQ
ncbi:MAG TPA: hypothetical protein VKN14_15420, partial [Flavobacteriaceae bacterium]|nr:hypothetical protein [Flavobacteriaceae bacterium]